MIVLLIMSVGIDPVIEDRVDIIEINTTYRDNGEPFIKQYCFWRLTRRGYRCDDWRVFYDGGPLPQREGGSYILVFYDDRHDVIRKVTATSFNVTHTHFDPERMNAREFDQSLRRRLTEP